MNWRKHLEILTPHSVVDWALIALALWFLYQAVMK
jgi:hypothetical protein